MATTTTLTGIGRGFAEASGAKTARRKRKVKTRAQGIIDCDITGRAGAKGTREQGNRGIREQGIGIERVMERSDGESTAKEYAIP
jgi:hypothetical protein